MKGIDVSKFQGKIDWQKVNGIDFALIRAGYGNDISQKDAKFEENIKGALAHGLHIGAYWFSYAISMQDALKEAEVFKKVLAPYKGKIDFPVAFDYEYDSIAYSKKHGVDPTNLLIDNIARAFLTSMKADGWFVNLYTNCDFIRSGKFSASTIKSYDVWLADYAGAPDFPCGIQQTGSTGTIPGINGHVDIDVATKDYPTIIKSGGYNGYPKIKTVSVQYNGFTLDTASKDMGIYQRYTVLARCSDKPAVQITGADKISVTEPYKDAKGRGWLIDVIGKSKGFAHITVTAGTSKQCNFNIK